VGWEEGEKFLRGGGGGKGGRCLGLTTLPPSCLESWKPQPIGILRACPGL